MDLNLIATITGSIGVFFVSVSFFPQLYDIYKHKNVKGTTWGLVICQIFACLTIGVSSVINYYLYGISNLPIVIANVIVLTTICNIGFFKCKYRNNI